MLFDVIGNAAHCLSLHPALKTAFAFLSDPGLACRPDGRVELDGQALYVTLSREAGRRREAGRLEAHRRYLDIHCVLEGVEEIGWKSTAACAKPSGAFDPRRDVGFYEDRPDAWVTLRPGMFALVWPHDAHLPLVSDGPIRKAVVKLLA